MSIACIATLALSFAPQDPAAQSGVLLVPGTTEAPEQPSRASRSRFRRTPRVNVPGATDDLGFHVVENPVHVHDLQATILHLLGFDHEKLTFHHAGRDFRLTDVHGKVVKDLLA